MNRTARGWLTRLLTIAAAVPMLALGAAGARADQIFTLSGVTFDDNTLLTGTFKTNDALNSLLDYDLTTTNGAITGFNYIPGTAGDSSSSLPFIIVLSTASLDRILQLTISGLTTAGGSIVIGQFDSFEQAGTTNPIPRREITGGSIVGGAPIPEPSSIVLAGSAALAGLALSARRRRAG